MSQSNKSEIIDTLENSELEYRDFKHPARIKRAIQQTDDPETRDVLQALLDQNEREKEKWRRTGHDEMAENPLERALGWKGLAGMAQRGLADDIDTHSARRNGSTPPGGDALAELTPADRADALRKLKKAESFQNRDMPKAATRVKNEAADVLGAADPDEIDLDTLKAEVSKDEYRRSASAGGSEDTDDGGTFDHLDDVETAEAKLRKAKHFRAYGQDARADTLEAEVRDHADGYSTDELAAAGHDTLARFLGPDHETNAAEMDSFAEVKNRIDILEGKPESLRARGLDERADEVEKELDALRERAEDHVR